MNGLSLFANVGIGETYLHKNNINIKVANELLEKRCNIYQYNNKKTTIIAGDISNDDIFEKVMIASIKHKCEFIIATPPCQGMSVAGQRKHNDNRNDLITYVVKAIDRLQPKYIIIENVPQIEKTKIHIDNQKVLIIDYLKKSLNNYKINYKVLNSADYGTAQSRKRMFILLSRNDVVEWTFNLVKKDVLTLKDKIGHLPSLKAGESSEIKYHYAIEHNPDHIRWMTHTPSGKTAIDNKINYPEKDGRRIKSYRSTYRRLRWDKPASTITMKSHFISSQNNVHPGKKLEDGTYSDARALTPLELILLTGLPAKWSVPEWVSDLLLREVIGEAVPPLLIYELTKVIKNAT
jgi:DNA (cytosine-5)-methyltransferase 1